MRARAGEASDLVVRPGEAVTANSAERSPDVASALNPTARQPIVVAMVAVLVATGAAAALVLVGIKHGEESRKFSDHIEYVTWATLAIGLVVVSVVGGVYSLPAWRELHARSRWSARLISYGVAVLITLCYDGSPQLFVRLFLHRASSPLSGSLCREIGLGILVALFTLPVVSGLVLAALLLSRDRLPWDDAGGAVAITELVRNRAHLQRFLAVLALVIGGSVLTAGAFRAALLAHAPQPPLHPLALLVYGAMMTGLLALVYVPAYLAWQAKARELRDALYPLPPDGCPNHDWYSSRADLEGLLNLKVNAGAAFATGLGLLTPFASSLVTAVIGTLAQS